MESLIDQLERLIQASSRLPVGGKLLVNEADLRQFVEQLRAALPDQQREAQRLAAERDRVLAEARSQARRIIEDAHGQTGVRLDDQAVVQAARQRARDITAEAEKTVAQLKADADQYILNQFTMMEARLTRVLREVQAGQRALARGQSGGEDAERGRPPGGPGSPSGT
jgi:cell division septum initiation protein DivIVA